MRSLRLLSISGLFDYRHEQTLCVHLQREAGAWLEPIGSGTLCGFRPGRRGWAASLLCRRINVIKNSDFFVVYSKSGIRTTLAFGGSIMWIASYICCLFSGWALTFIAAPRPPATVTNPHIVRSLGSKETHIQSHNRVNQPGLSSEQHCHAIAQPVFPPSTYRAARSVDNVANERSAARSTDSV